MTPSTTTVPSVRTAIACGDVTGGVTGGVTGAG
jgi:hypothetical protein